MKIQSLKAGSIAACFLLFLLSRGSLFAQNPQVVAIQSLNTALSQAIAACDDETEDFCGYYLNRLTSNANGGPWAAVGTYISTRSYWYQFVDGEEGQEMVLRKLTIETHRSARREKSEYTFGEDGRLLWFHFLEIEDRVLQQFDFYFAAGKLLDYKENVLPEVAEYQLFKKTDAANVLKDAEEHIAFLKTSFD